MSKHFLELDNSSLELMKWLKIEFIPQVVQLFNEDQNRKRLAIYQGEKIPENERNLTDVRNRISLIIEYEIARFANTIFEKMGLSEPFFSYVVANRFPDLEVRNNSGMRRLRLEIKSLQSIAEEKSANFDTLLKDIDPGTDFVLIFLWDWDYSLNPNISWDRAPRIEAFYVMHAYSLALLRDTYWLSNPPSDLGNGYQGFDLRFAINCRSGEYSQEEGNYGKLTRIWQEGFTPRPKTSVELNETEGEFLKFKREVIEKGFENLSRQMLERLTESNVFEKISLDGDIVGYQSEAFGIFLKSKVSIVKITEICKSKRIEKVIALTDKYQSTGYRLENQSLRKVFNPIKPKLVSTERFNLVSSSR